MSRVLQLFVLLFVSLGASAQQPTMHIRGYVTNAQSRRPVSGAAVNVVGGQAKSSAVTDANGLFILALQEDIKPGDSIRVRVEKQGYTAYDVTTAATEAVPLQIQLSPADSGKGRARRTEPPEQQPTIGPPPQVSLYLGCEWDHIPIYIPAASTIHVIRLHPGILYGNPTIPAIGVFEDVSSKGNQSLDWPSESEGRWMTESEQRAVAETKGIPTPYAFKCSMSNYGTSTLEDIAAQLIINTSDGKCRTYPVSFDPLISGHSFSFYVVNVCSCGVTPTSVQWGEAATVHVLGEKDKRRVPLKFEKRNWPATLIPIFGPSWFLWNGMQSCQWDMPAK